MKNHWLEQNKAQQESWLVYDNIDPIQLTEGETIKFDNEWEEMPVLRENYQELMLDHQAYLTEACTHERRQRAMMYQYILQGLKVF